MTVESAIHDALRDLVTTAGSPPAYRVYPDFAPLGAIRPYIVFQQVGGESPQFLERASPSKKNGRFQISVWGDTRTAVAALARQVEAAMVASTAFSAKPLGDCIATADPATELRGSLQDFSVWSDR